MTLGDPVRVSDTRYTVTATPAAGTTGDWVLSMAPDTVRDLAGNGNSVVASLTQAIDTQAPAQPTVLDIAGSDNAINAAERAAGVDIRGTAEAGATVRLSFGPLEGAGQPGAPSSRTVTVVADGDAAAEGGRAWSYRLQPADFALLGQGDGRLVRAVAIDAVGNASAATERTIRIDTVNPLLSPLVLPDAVQAPGGPLRSRDASPALRFTAEAGTDNLQIDWDGDGLFEQQLGGTGIAETLSPPPGIALADGPRTIRVRATDAAGNSTERQIAFLLDTVAPTVARDRRGRHPEFPVLGAAGDPAPGDGLVRHARRAGGRSRQSPPLHRLAHAAPGHPGCADHGRGRALGRCCR